MGRNHHSFAAHHQFLSLIHIFQEGMERYKGFIGESFDTKVQIVENGVRYIVDVQDGQKTGFFLDQKYNRLACLLYTSCKCP